LKPPFKKYRPGDFPSAEEENAKAEEIFRLTQGSGGATGVEGKSSYNQTNTKFWGMLLGITPSPTGGQSYYTFACLWEDGLYVGNNPPALHFAEDPLGFVGPLKSTGVVSSFPAYEVNAATATVSSKSSIITTAAVITGTAASGGLIKITTGAANGLTTGDVVIIWGVQGTSEANGQWTITTVDGTHFTLDGSTWANAWTSGGDWATFDGSIVLMWPGEGGEYFCFEAPAGGGATIGPVTNNVVSKGLGTNNVQDSTATDDGTTFSLTKDLALSIGSVTLKGGSITNASNATPIVITSVGHGLVDHECVRIESVGGNTAANGNWRITFVDADNFSLDGSVGSGGYTTGGKWYEGTLILPDTVQVDLESVYQIYEIIDSTSTWTGSAWTLNSAGRTTWLRISSVAAGTAGYPAQLTSQATFWNFSVVGITLPSALNITTQPSGIPSVLPSGAVCKIVNSLSATWELSAYRPSGYIVGLNNHYTGTTTSSLVTVFNQCGSSTFAAAGLDQAGNVFGAAALHGGFAITNTDSTNSLKYSVVTTDMFNTATTSTLTTLVAGASAFVPFMAVNLINAGQPPFKLVKLQVEDAVGGVHATYSVFLCCMG